MSDNNIPGGKKFGILETELIKTFVSRGETKAKNNSGPIVRFTDADEGALLTKEQVREHDRAMANASPLVKSVLNVLNGGSNDSIERLAFEIDPGMSGQHSALWRRKLRLLPNDVIKRILIQDDLVAAIVNTRSSHVSNFGRPQPDRHSLGYKIEAEAGLTEKMDDNQKKELQERIARAELLLLSCGQTKGWSDDEALSLSQYLFMSTRNAVGMGMIATEVIYHNTNEGKKFHSFRPIDAGTIYRASPQKTQAQAVRREALHLLETVKSKKLVPERYMNDEYSWVQVISGRPVQAFTSEECLVHNFYPTTDVELDGYPVTPLDTVISAVTTHINATTHNRLWFQNGRAARNAIVVRSDDADERMINKMTQDFNAKINSVSNSWRVPIIGIGSDDEITMLPMDGAGRDMEFQYLSDTNARVILSAFQISPEEVPGYGHLCLSPDTLVWTNKGLAAVGSLLGDKTEASGFSVWTGKKWTESRVFATGKKNVAKTHTSNGVSITTSPDHLFRAVDERGELCWRKQSELSVGDVILVNRMPAPGHESNVPSYRGKKLSCDMMEVLGWLTGDGSISVRKAGKTKHSKNLDFYYHHEKEKEIQQRHASILQEFGLSPTVKKVLRTEAQIERQKAAFGFKSVASERIFTTLHDTEFVGWLLDLGFAPSTSEKAIPDFIFAFPVEHRAAFLKGFFSADGTIDSLNTPSISISSESTREKTKNLLLSMGIRTRACEGKTKNSFQKNGAWDYQKVTKNAASKLIIKDKHEFFERIGFLQDHKQPDLEALAKSDKRWDKIHKSVAVSLCDKMLAGDAVKGHEARDVVRHALKEMPSPFRVRSNVQRIAEQYGFSLPKWTEEFYQEFVSATEQSEEQIDMVDIEVFDDVHAFVANGIVVHNSRGTNSQALSESNQEYKLQAARDVGIRPLLAHFQAFINQRILPLIDPELAKIAHFKFVGLDADTAEKESVRLQQDLSVHMTMDEVLDQVEKRPIGERWGGRILLNPQWHQMVADKYLLVGDILEHFFGIKGASQDPRFQYVNNPLWFQWQQIQMQMQAQQMQAQQMQAQGAQQGPPQDGQPPQEGQPQDPGQQQDQGQQPQELTRAIDQLATTLNKAEYQLSPGHRKLLVQQRLTVQNALKTLEKEADEAVDEILNAAEDSLPDHLKE